MGHKFSYTRDDGTYAEVGAGDYCSMEDIIEAFKCYLLACGYQPESIAEYLGDENE